MELTLQTLSPRCQISGREFTDGERVVSFLVRPSVGSELPLRAAGASETRVIKGSVAAASSVKKSDPAGGKVEGAEESVVRYDVAEEAAGDFVATGAIVCRWAQVFRTRKVSENAERTLKLTAETLFLTLSDPANERTVETERLLQVLAMMLERKRVLRPKGRTGSGASARQVYEHAKAKTVHEVQAAELSPEFFMSIQGQLAALVGGGGKKFSENAGESTL